MTYMSAKMIKSVVYIGGVGFIGLLLLVSIKAKSLQDEAHPQQGLVSGIHSRQER